MGAAVSAAEGTCAPEIGKVDLSKVFEKVRGELEEVRHELGCAAEVTESAAPFGFRARNLLRMIVLHIQYLFSANGPSAFPLRQVQLDAALAELKGGAAEVVEVVEVVVVESVEE